LAEKSRENTFIGLPKSVSGQRRLSRELQIVDSKVAVQLQTQRIQFANCKSKIRAPFGLVIGLASIEARESLRQVSILPE